MSLDFTILPFKYSQILSVLGCLFYGVIWRLLDYIFSSLCIGRCWLFLYCTFFFFFFLLDGCHSHSIACWSFARFFHACYINSGFCIEKTKGWNGHGVM
ncbi:hypothetical protein VTL71DRAFT_5490 [Oculimacula yallundae]|uniref:Uncharacterized protein n=1 Tax=Oculimacula yallundae TaxID=86028 RepID=A0ABR4C1T8_9HELO